MLLSRRAWLASAAAACSCTLRNSRGFSGLAFVANADGKALAAVDLSALAVVRHIRLDHNPTEVVNHPSASAVYALTPDSASIHEVSPGTLDWLRSTRLPSRPAMLKLSPGHQSLWALLPEQRQVVRVDTERLETRSRTALESAPAAFEFGPAGTPQEDVIAVSLTGSGRVAFVNARDGRLARSVPLGRAIGPLAFRTDGRYLLAGDLAERQLVIYDVEAGRVAVRLPLPVRPDQFCMKPDGGQLFITGAGMDAVVTVYPYQTEIGSITLAGRAPAAMAVSTAPDYLFVANPQSGNVTILNVQTQRVQTVATVGREPCFITVTPDNTYALVLNRQSGDMTVLHVETIAVRRPGPRGVAAPMSMIPVGSSPVAAVVRSV